MSELARSFERAAEDYERGRPGYPEEALDAVPLPRDAVVLDLAAGTGKLTRELVRRHRRVLAVEPLDAMRAILARVVPQAEPLAGSAEAIPLADASVDGVFVADAFHWFDAGAVGEVARVLRPPGVLAVLFNVAHVAWEPPIPQAVWDAYDAVAVVKPPERTVASAAWKAPFPGPFEPFVESTHANPVERDAEDAVASLLSHSAVAVLPTAERERLRETIRALLPAARYTQGLQTKLYVARLR